jgi:hypothetical protein
VSGGWEAGEGGAGIGVRVAGAHTRARSSHTQEGLGNGALHSCCNIVNTRHSDIKEMVNV